MRKRGVSTSHIRGEKLSDRCIGVVSDCAFDVKVRQYAATIMTPHLASTNQTLKVAMRARKGVRRSTRDSGGRCRRNVRQSMGRRSRCLIDVLATRWSGSRPRSRRCNYRPAWQWRKCDLREDCIENEFDACDHRSAISDMLTLGPHSARTAFPARNVVVDNVPGCEVIV